MVRLDPSFFLLLFALLAPTLLAEGVEQVQLSYWHGNSPSEVRLAERVVKAFHQAQSVIRVIPQRIPSSRSSEEVLLAAILSRSTPDICSNVSPGILPKLARAQAVHDLQPLRAHLEARYGEAVPAGFIESLAWKVNPVLLFTNLQLLEGLGETVPPATYPELTELARSLKLQMPGKWVMNPNPRMTWWERFFDFLPFYLAASDGHDLLDETGHAAFSGPAGEQVLSFFRLGFSQGWFPRSPPVRDIFVDGDLLFRIAGAHYLPQLLQETKGTEFRFAVSPIPTPQASSSLSYTFRDSKHVVVFSTCKRPEAAMEFLRFFSEETRDSWLLEETLQVPLRNGIEANPLVVRVLEQTPGLRPFCLQAPRTRPLPRTEHLVQIFDILSEAYEAAGIYGIVEPAAALKRAAARIDYLVENWK